MKYESDDHRACERENKRRTKKESNGSAGLS